MLGRLREWIADRGDPEDANGGEADGADEGFVRSVLDASVLVGHGQGNVAAKQELDDLDEEGERLAEAREDRR